MDPEKTIPDAGVPSRAAAIDHPSDIIALSAEQKPAENALTDWDGPDDPGNPRNWSSSIRVFGVFVPAYYAFAVTFGTSIYSAGVFDVMARFDVSRTLAISGLSLYALGLAFGPVLGAPISETYGRKYVYTITMPLLLLFTTGAGLAKNIGTLLVCRFLAAFLGGPALAVGAGSVADLWDMQQGGAIAGMFFILMPFLGSASGPLVGGYTVDSKHDYAWTMWVLIIVGGPAWLLSFFMPETYQLQILKQRAKARGSEPPPRLPPKQAIKLLLGVTLLRPIHMLLFEPIVGCMSLYIAFVFGIMFAFFDAYPYVFIYTYGFSLGEVGLAFLGIIVGILTAAMLFAVVDKTIYAKSKAKMEGTGKIPPPEERLYVCLLASILLPISLFWFAWTSRPSVHWIVPILAGWPFGCAMVLLFVGTSVYFVDTYQALNGASSIAANNLLRLTFGAAFPLFTVQMIERLGIGWAGSLLGFISLAMLPIPWALYKWGPILRRRSHYPTGNF